MTDKQKAISELVDLIKALRAENGCPWDRVQTPKTMRIYLVEEMYELLEALDSENSRDIEEELGDVLFQIFFLARIFEEQKLFDIYDVADKTTRKMTGRHPHVFGDEKAESAREVRAKWDKFKKQTNPELEDKGPFDSIPKSMPSLLRAYRIIERASRTGKAFFEGMDALKLTTDSWKECISAFGGKDKKEMEKKTGDFLFSLVLLCRKQGIHPDTALNARLKGFVNDFDGTD